MKNLNHYDKERIFLYLHLIHLIDQWQEYMNIAKVPAMVISRGKIQDTFRFERPNDDNTIILDEAHYYRNDLTIDYGDLHYDRRRQRQMCIRDSIYSITFKQFIFF